MCTLHFRPYGLLYFYFLVLRQYMQEVCSYSINLMIGEGGRGGKREREICVTEKV